MTKETETYKEHVENLETGLAIFAKKSFEPFSQTFVDGRAIYDYYEAQWRASPGKLKFLNRTPLQLERDRILYSGAIRKQTEKYHVLYNGPRRIVRNYTTHTMRMAQVTRSICRGLGLNADFAEAIAIGSKAGAVPFIHATKGPIGEWIKQRVWKLDENNAKTTSQTVSAKKQLSLSFGEVPIPTWIDNLKSASIIDKVQRFIPWAAGKDVDEAYSAGQQGYWMLSINPFLIETRSSDFCPETMIGIWRHTRGKIPKKDSFMHRLRIDGGDGARQHELRWDQFTYEAIVVQYADDITWVIENLNDANTAALLSRKSRGVYQELLDVLDREDGAPEHLMQPLRRNDSGGIYTYFIADFVRNSADVLSRLKDGAYARTALRSGDLQSIIGLSPEGENQLNKLANYLYREVFTEPRVRNRTQMLKTVSLACLDLLYEDWEETVPKILQEKMIIERWPKDALEKANDMLKDPVHRIQVAVDILADMGDQEIYDFVGIQAL